MKGVPLSNFVRNLGGMTGRFVIDKTGLTGRTTSIFSGRPIRPSAALRNRRPLWVTALPCLRQSRNNSG